MEQRGTRAVHRPGALCLHQGAYGAPRAAALAGVPLSTLHHWSRNGTVVPSISPVREKLFSFADIMTLRIVVWLRREKHVGDREVPRTPMDRVREALQQLEGRGSPLWTPAIEGPGVSPVLVDPEGKIYLRRGGKVHDLQGQIALPEDCLDVLGPFEEEGLRGPDLVRPRPHLRIVPGKLSGEPHVARTRLSTLAVAALASSGMAIEGIALLYPDCPQQALEEAIDLEQDLERNRLAVAAA